MTPARPAALARVAARMREHAASMERVVEALDEALGRWAAEPQDRIAVHWVGGLVHDFYTGLEKAFTMISPELNGIDLPTGSWHRELLHAMTLEVPGFRPQVIRPSLEPRLLELMKFRHVYRNLYSFDLRWERVRPLAVESRSMWPEAREDLLAFAGSLEALANQMGD